MDSYIGSNNCNDYRIGNNTIKKLYKGDTLIWEKSVVPTAVTGWVALSSITNTVPFDAIAWGTGYTPVEMDCWVSEIPGVVSDGMGWSDGVSDELGHFSNHRWNNGGDYSETFLNEIYGYDHPDVEYGISVTDRGRDTLPTTSITVNEGEEEVEKEVYLLEFKDFTGWTACYGAFSAASYYYAGELYVRAVSTNVIGKFLTTSANTFVMLYNPHQPWLEPSYQFDKMIIDGVLMDRTSSYRFENAGLHTVEYILTRSYTSIWWMQFIRLDNLVELYIPPQVTSIGPQGIDANHYLSSLTLYNSVQEILQENSLGINCPDINGIKYAGDIAFDIYRPNLPSNLTFKPSTRCIAGLYLGSPSQQTDSVTSVTIPKYCATIQHATFLLNAPNESGASITSITLEGKVVRIEDRYQSGTFRLPPTGTAHLPAGIDNDLFISYLPSGWTVEYYTQEDN